MVRPPESCSMIWRREPTTQLPISRAQQDHFQMGEALVGRASISAIASSASQSAATDIQIALRVRKKRDRETDNQFVARYEPENVASIAISLANKAGSNPLAGRRG